MQKTGDFESSVQCSTTVEEDHTQMLGGEASGISSSMKEPMLSSTEMLNILFRVQLLLKMIVPDCSLGCHWN